MFHIKVEQKPSEGKILIKDLLEIFSEVFKYILKHLQTFFHLEDHNECFLTLCQTSSLINGLNTGNYFIIFQNIIFHKKSLHILLGFCKTGRHVNFFCFVLFVATKKWWQK